MKKIIKLLTMTPDFKSDLIFRLMTNSNAKILRISSDNRVPASIPSILLDSMILGCEA
ncbi:MAG: hypothetical protein J6X35_04245 [Bacteroidales bacterium]|nr:hypothetical protein [Bacteroidales bacterium]